jgi:hypothetical protein
MVFTFCRCLAQNIGLGGITDMTINTRANREKFIMALTDVVWRFHTYNQYGAKRDKAITALTKRAPGHPSKYYEEMFDLHLKILINTIPAVENAPKHPKPDQQYSEYSDVDTEYVLKTLQKIFPDQTDKSLNNYLGMVIYYYYMR